ncbi:MAG: Crp/Fnr family transcriptional regulator [Gammaproteobacteria bacterium]|jgi:CRP/FNR family transcriptional regulator, anaerobic regulatory protein|nr:Crp/Fnr family transcriptional regulator [Gammaproteobacteria bacterium]MBU0769996.1 Crp/Fnr family transcriptional regulator [Gammaproteobacteria bacterium]MBU0857169.1 Crp/Fnr family transcriptional regulator [Gammaproteobacteria bacterium]MBU1848171.1 Crp/Fnr family transcriptional regulator [Gammaproteobacteria bacterium]
MNATADMLTTIYPLLSGLSPAARARIESEGRLLELPAGTVIFDEHQPCVGFPFVLEGQVKIAKSSASGRELPLYRVHTGETCVISSACLLGQLDYNAHAIAESAVRLLVLPSYLFDELMAEPPFRRFVFGLFAERVAELMQLVEAIAFQRLDQRLAALLLGHGRTFHATHQQLADELGSVREIVSRLLKSFAEQGFVALGRNQIDILDPAGLRALAADRK